LAHDLCHDGSMPSQVDTRPFEIGRNIAITQGASCTAPTCSS
jgi:poly(3-hydroxyalkanoate) synthetase